MLEPRVRGAARGGEDAEQRHKLGHGARDGVRHGHGHRRRQVAQRVEALATNGHVHGVELCLKRAYTLHERAHLIVERARCLVCSGNLHSPPAQRRELRGVGVEHRNVGHPRLKVHGLVREGLLGLTRSWSDGLPIGR